MVKQSLSRSDPAAVREVYRLLLETPRIAGTSKSRSDVVYRHGLIPRRFAVDELYDDVTRTLEH